jgi:hypothetical protein
LPPRTASSARSSKSSSQRPEPLECRAEQRVVGLGARGEADDLVGDDHAGGLGRGDLGAGGAAVVGGDHERDRLLDLGGAGHERAGERVVDAEELALGAGADGAGRVLGGDGVEDVVAERERHHELADVVQEAAEVRDVGRRSGALGDPLRGPGDRRGVQVQVADRAATVARGALEEAVRGSLERELGDRLAAHERDGGADAASAQRTRAGGGVRVAQQVGGEALVGLERGDHVADARVLALGDHLDPADRGAEHGQPPEALHGALETLIRLGHSRFGQIASHGVCS